jgi:hypothetical protein
VEEVAVLGDHADRAPQVGGGQVAHVDVAEGDRAGVGVVQPGDERGDGGLAGTRRPTRATVWPWLDPERDAVEHLLAHAVVEDGHLLERGQGHLVGRRVAEADVPQVHGQRTVGQRHGRRRLPDERFDVEHTRTPARS